MPPVVLILFTNPVISHEWGKIRAVLRTSGTYRSHLWHRNSMAVNQVMVATVKLGSVASLLVATLYEGNTDRNHKLWNIVSTERYILHMQVLLECCYIYMESSQWENWNHLFCRKVSFLTASHCQFEGVGQGMKQTYMYLWYPLFEAQWDRCDQRNHQT